MSLTPRFIAPVREAALGRRVCAAEHMHGASRHAHPHLHDDDALCDGYSLRELSDHSHCRFCGNDDRLCGHQPHKKNP